jgi:hypothetical protein
VTSNPAPSRSNFSASADAPTSAPVDLVARRRTTCCARRCALPRRTHSARSAPIGRRPWRAVPTASAARRARWPGRRRSAFWRPAPMTCWSSAPARGATVCTSRAAVCGSRRSTSPRAAWRPFARRRARPASSTCSRPLSTTAGRRCPSRMRASTPATRTCSTAWRCRRRGSRR